MREYYERHILDSGLQREFRAWQGVWKLKFNHLDFILLLPYKYKRFAKGYLVISMKKISIFCSQN